jgi:hypothetical protein
MSEPGTRPALAYDGFDLDIDHIRRSWKIAMPPGRFVRIVKDMHEKPSKTAASQNLVMSIRLHVGRSAGVTLDRQGPVRCGSRLHTREGSRGDCPKHTELENRRPMR